MLARGSNVFETCIDLVSLEDRGSLCRGWEKGIRYQHCRCENISRIPTSKKEKREFPEKDLHSGGGNIPKRSLGKGN